MRKYSVRFEIFAAMSMEAFIELSVDADTPEEACAMAGVQARDCLAPRFCLKYKSHREVESEVKT